MLRVREAYNTNKNVPLIHGISFNQDNTCFSVSLDNGFRIYSLDPLKENSKTVFNDGGVEITTMLYRCNYLALVGGGRYPKYPPNKVSIWDAAKNACVIQLEFKSPVKSVLLSKNKIVVVLLNSVLVYTFESTPRKIGTFETGDNESGLAALCSQENNELLVFPGKKPGHIHLVNLNTIGVASSSASDLFQEKSSSFHSRTSQTAIISAHTADVSCIALNSDGSLVATSSEKGTLVRVFSTSSGSLLHELRRGTDRADIWTISFNQDSSKLCVGSDKGTIHIFNLTSPNTIPASSEVETIRPSSYPGNRQSSFSFMRDYLPKYFSSEWSFTTCHVPSAARYLATFGHDPNTLIVVASDGSYYKFEFDEHRSGEVRRVAYHKFLKFE